MSDSRLRITISLLGLVVCGMILGSIFATLWWNPCDLPHVRDAHSCRALIHVPASPEGSHG